MKPIRTGMIGVGRFGQNHNRILSSLPECHHTGLFDIDRARADEISRRDDVKNHTSLESLLAESEAVVIAVDTAAHFDVASRALSAGKHVLVEKPICPDLSQVRELLLAAKSAGLGLYTGHLERFNAGIRHALSLVPSPAFISAERHGLWTHRLVTADVVHDLMIHDLDILLQTEPGKPVTITAWGRKAVSDHLDMCSAALKMESGTLCTLSASRAASERRRLMRLADANREVVVDMISQQCYLIAENGTIEEQQIERSEPLRVELQAFLRTVGGEAQPALADGSAGLIAVELAQKVLQSIDYEN